MAHLLHLLLVYRPARPHQKKVVIKNVRLRFKNNRNYLGYIKVDSFLCLASGRSYISTHAHKCWEALQERR